METFLTTAATYGVFLLPFLTSFFGSMFLYKKGISKVKDAADTITGRDDITRLVGENQALREEIRQANRAIRLLTDKITRIEGYADYILNEEEV